VLPFSNAVTGFLSFSYCPACGRQTIEPLAKVFLSRPHFNDAAGYAFFEDTQGFPEELAWNQNCNETMGEDDRVLIGDSFRTAAISLKGAEAKTGGAGSIEEADKIEERYLTSNR
jgi:hypothetical protein